jgi:phage FluMu protein Com
MKLPTLNTPKYTLVLPSTGKTIEYRPFLVKEEKILMIAQESGDTDELTRAMIDVVRSCTFDAIDISKLSSFDIEYIFLKLRAKSVGEEVSIGIKCDNCENVNNIKINLDNIEVTKNQDLPKKIMLTETVGIIPKYISINEIQAISKITDKSKSLVQTIAANIESIFDANNVYPISETSFDELDSFISSLNRQQVSKLEDLIKNQPKIEKNIKFKCNKCETHNDKTLSGIQTFFE